MEQGTPSRRDLARDRSAGILILLKRSVISLRSVSWAAGSYNFSSSIKVSGL